MHLFAVFHLNLAYSSIEENQRPEVIDKCYWPLLRLARAKDLPFGIEATGWTLETAATIDPAWIKELKALVGAGRCEFVGSGYSQIIGPLVPEAVNAANLRIGNSVYAELLGVKPSVALVNEQAYSAGLVPVYLAAGYEAIAMEWNNPSRYHPDWDPSWRFLPQMAAGPDDQAIPVIWSDSIVFQKFQRYVHGEFELEQYLDYLAGHIGETTRAMPLYANDVEIFDYRPGRYRAEPVLAQESEWDRIGLLFERLEADSRFSFIAPRQVLELKNLPGSGHTVRLESPEQPVPVKKQEKYNLSRWAITGRDDFGANSKCWHLYKNIADLAVEKRFTEDELEAAWKELCYLWSSDFRTHITQKRWEAYQARLDSFTTHLSGLKQATAAKTVQPSLVGSKSDTVVNVQRRGSFLDVATQSVSIVFNLRRGMAIDSLALGRQAEPIIGTIPHGFYEDISLGADYYTGHTVVEIPGRMKVTDLNMVEVEYERAARNDEKGLLLRAMVPTDLGPVTKEIFVYESLPRVELSYVFGWEPVFGSLRTGIITLRPQSFDLSSLYFRTCNGGPPESFDLSGHMVNHGAPATTFVSASQGFGTTEGWVELGDASKSVVMEIDRDVSSAFPLLVYREIEGTFFCRLSWSLGEVDETRKIDSADQGSSQALSLSLYAGRYGA